MAIMTGLFRLGRDAELRFTPNGDPVVNLALAYNHGAKGQDGNRPTQWVDAALYGKRAEALIDYLVKGQQVVVTIDDPHIETYEGRNGPGHKLAGRISSIELAGSRQEGAARQAPAAPAAQQPQRQAPAQTANGFDVDDSDIPF